MDHDQVTGLPRRIGRCLWALVVAAGLFSAFPAPAQSPGGLDTRVKVNGDISTSARGGGSASTQIGSSPSGGGTSSTWIGGDVTTQSDGGSGSTVLGGQDRDGTTVIRGSVANHGGQVRATGNTTVGGNIVTQDGADVDLGGCGSTYVAGNVIVPHGSLEIGCGCAGRRNGQCCLQFHHGFCALQIVPPGKHGCPPRFIYSEGLCWLYSDFDHRVGD